MALQITPDEIARVQASFAEVEPMADTAAALFYMRLFELAPELRPLFRGDMADQRRKLMGALALAVGSLDRRETIAPALRALAVRHVGYGVRAKDYETVGTALLWSLERTLGDDFSPDLRRAWSAAYAALAGIMRQAAAEHAPGRVAA